MRNIAYNVDCPLWMDYDREYRILTVVDSAWDASDCERSANQLLELFEFRSVRLLDDSCDGELNCDYDPHSTSTH